MTNNKKLINQEGGEPTVGCHNNVIQSKVMSCIHFYHQTAH